MEKYNYPSDMTTKPYGGVEESPQGDKESPLNEAMYLALSDYLGRLHASGVPVQLEEQGKNVQMNNIIEFFRQKGALSSRMAPIYLDKLING